MKLQPAMFLAACIAGAGLMTSLSGAVIRPATRPAIASAAAVPSTAPEAGDPYLKRFTFLGDQLAADEATITALNEALVGAGYKAATAANKVADAIKGNELMDRKGGAPVPWQNFYGRTARDFSPGYTTGVHNNYQRPTQFDYVYRANDTVAQRARTEVNAMGKKTDALLARRAQLEAEQSSLWATLAFESVQNRDIPQRLAYRNQLKAGSGKMSDNRPDEARLAAMRAGVVYLRTIDQTIGRLVPRVAADQIAAYGALRATLDKALADLLDADANFTDTSNVDAAELKQMKEVVNLAKRGQTLCWDICDSYAKALEADKAHEDQRKLLFRATLQDSLFTFAETTSDIDNALMKIAADWDIVPETGVKSSDEPIAMIEGAALAQDSKSGERVKQADVLRPLPAGNGWVSVFDGKELRGWEVGGLGAADNRGNANWTVTDGAIVASGGRGPGTLTTTTAGYNNFQFRIRTKLTEQLEAFVVLVPASPDRTPVRIAIGSTNPAVNVTTGDISLGGVTKSNAKKIEIAADQWFVLRIDYNGTQLAAFVNGEKVSEYSDREIANIHAKLQLIHRQNSLLQVHDAQIHDRTAPASAPPSNAVPAKGRGRGL